ncbi:MAG: hypothetical protein JWM65_594, partial [Sphingomonas bacterium]|nr:hypothetical protein [Sphingomonas bacterium]
PVSPNPPGPGPRSARASPRARAEPQQNGLHRRNLAVNHAPYPERLLTSPLLTSVLPATVEETAWDILLALHADRRQELSLAQLSSRASVSKTVLDMWLANLEERDFITGALHRWTGELIAALTARGRNLLDQYLSVSANLRVGAHH